MRAPERAARPSVAWPVCVLIFLLPFEVYGVEVAGAKVTPAFAFMILLFPVYLLHLLDGRTVLRLDAVTALFGLYLLVGLVTVPQTDNPGQAIITWGGQALMFLAFVYANSYVDSRVQVERVITCTIATGIVVATMGLAEFVGWVVFGLEVVPPFALREPQPQFGFMGGLTRMHGFFVSAARLGGYLLIPVFLAAYRVTTTTGWRRALSIGCAGVLSFTLLLSTARNAYLATVLSLVCLLMLRRTANVIRDSALLAAGLLVLVYLNPETGIPFIDAVNPYTTNADIAAVAGEDLAQFASHLRLALVAGFENFGLGRGIQNFDEWAFQVGDAPEWGAHSNLLHFLGETGVVGLTLQTAIVAWLVFVSLHRIRTGRRTSLAAEDPLPRLLLATFLGLVATGVVRTYYFSEYTFMLAALLLRVAAPDPGFALEPRRAAPTRRLETA